MRAHASILAALVLLASPAIAADPAAKCEAAKLKAAAKFAACRLQADAKAAKKGGLPDYEKCEKIVQRFAKAEQKGGADCPSLGDLGDVRGAVEPVVGRVAVALRGAVCLGSDVCGDGQYCETPDGYCEELGACTMISLAMCPLVFDPVCGCDGVTYDNDCLRAKAGVGQRLPAPCP